jgi:hypothetical protein
MSYSYTARAESCDIGNGSEHYEWVDRVPLYLLRTTRPRHANTSQCLKSSDDADFASPDDRVPLKVLVYWFPELRD